MTPVSGSPVPLAVDLDGTLTLTDTLHESVIDLLRHSPLAVLPLARALSSGKAAVKRAVAQRVDFDATLLPYNPALLSTLRAHRAAGRRLGLFTAADQSIADAVAAHLGIFDVVRGSDGVLNLSGAAKATAIEAAFGPVFAYAGDSTTDLPVFARAAAAILVGPKIGRLMHASRNIEARFPLPKPGAVAWVRALRPWNGLLFVIPVLALQPVPPLSCCILLSALASGITLLRDLGSLAADRVDPGRCGRPLAAGLIPVRDGAVVAVILVAGSLPASLPLGYTSVLLCCPLIALLYGTIRRRLVSTWSAAPRTTGGGTRGVSPLVQSAPRRLD
jgi:phosphoserine phosphatase